LFLEDPRDEFVLEHLHSFDGKKLVSAAKADVKLDRPADPKAGLNPEEVGNLASFLKEALGDRVGTVRASERLVGSPVAVREAEGALSPSMRRMMKLMGKEEAVDLPEKPDFEINPDHPMIVKLATLSRTDEGLARQVGGQLFDNAMVAAGLIEDPRAVLGRLNQLLERLMPGSV
jgi:molecular chaperone HtpG